MTAFPLPFSYGARVSLIGMGVSNRGVLVMLGARPDLRLTLRDQKAFSLAETLPFNTSPRILVGDDYLKALSDDVLFLAPTVKTNAPEIQAARARGALVTTDSAFFFENTTTAVFAVTGSDGKSTTATLAAQILSLCGTNTRLGGNIGTPLSPFLPEEKEGDFTVSELSSFQLMHPHKAPKRALLTNLTPNHLDFHSSLEEYYNVKIGLLKSACEPILNLDDAQIRKRTNGIEPFVGYTTETAYAGCRAEHLYSVRDGAILQDGEVYLSLDGVRHHGIAFCKNLLAALALTHGYHDRDTLAEHLYALRPLAHRRELVRKINGVSFYNSSVDSSPSRTLQTLADFEGGVILILGGRGKGVSYTVLREAINKKARAVILTGENAAEIRSELPGLCVPICECESLADAVAFAAELAHEGDTVLFSPASTSFDRFQNFEERGKCFSRLVQAL